MKHLLCSLIGLMMVGVCAAQQAPVVLKAGEVNRNTQWNGKRVAYLGDSVTDSLAARGSKRYWAYLQELMGIEPLVYGINGHQWTGVYGQAEKLIGERGQEVDAIMIFAGTNDFNASVTLGRMFDEEVKVVEIDGQLKVKRKHRTPSMDVDTFYGRVNRTLQLLKEAYPSKQVIVLTPIHRGYAIFGPGNIQPDDSYCNAIGLYLESYVEALKQAATWWSVPIIDLYGESGLMPNLQSQTPYIYRADTDRLHPGSVGHYHIAKTMQYRLQSLAPCFE